MLRKATLTFLLLGTLMISSAALAADMQMSTGILCDEQEQVEDFAAYVNDGIDIVMAAYAVNEAAGSRACAVMTSLFERHEGLVQITYRKWRATIARVEVYGIFNRHGAPVVMSNSPILTQYTIFEYDGL